MQEMALCQITVADLDDLHILAESDKSEELTDMLHQAHLHIARFGIS